MSVILPVYNAEKYLRTCVGSILAQTYRNIELIMINDGSKDGSLAICRELETTDPRIRVFDKPNGGCSTARNMGIEQARGELLTFIDPDDFMLPDHIAALVEASDGVDMGIVGFLRTKPKAAYRQLTDKDRAKAQKRRTVFGMKEFMRGMLAFPTYGGGVVWNKLFRKSLIGELRFDENCFYFDDLNFLFKYGLRCRSFCCLPLKTYMYVVNPNSNSAKNISPRKLTCLNGMQEVAELAAETDEDIAVYARSWQFLINIEVTWLMHVNRYKDDTLRARIMQTMQETYPDFKKNKHNYHSYRRLGGLAYRLIRLFRY